MSEQKPEPQKRVDESWKARVEEEKRQQQSSSAVPDDPPLPAPTFLLHVSGLVAQCWAALGLAPDPTGAPSRFRPNLARHLIDTLAMLEAKTRGNLEPAESQTLQEALHQLRLAFLQQQKAAPAGGKGESGGKTAAERKILTP